ncbi:mitochondrial ribosomal protein subunit L20-domain-containing protein [Thelephora terrestris]|uniref:Mitochondrial ribosomal protein subunit L20-domain-containing protein n=1 Tax=Thelephora terrestris TaxID=56493 RepID=A0A9P6H5R8_9AGAM|nr:mitochondrial ribosomal protein subunit L20-domain-containing protein [Thelephora terrestris]
MSALARTLRRCYSTRLPTRPPSRVPDPLADVPKLTLEDNVTFIHRPPPTMPSPESFTTSPSSPLLRPPAQPQSTTNPFTDPSLPPVSRPSLIPKKQYPQLTDQAIRSMRDLRHSNPAKWTCTKLAAKFNCAPGFVSLVAGLKSGVWKQRVRNTADLHQRERDKWGEKKALAHKIRAKKREFW